MITNTARSKGLKLVSETDSACLMSLKFVPVSLAGGAAEPHHLGPIPEESLRYLVGKYPRHLGPCGLGVD